MAVSFVRVNVTGIRRAVGECNHDRPACRRIGLQTHRDLAVDFTIYRSKVDVADPQYPDFQVNVGSFFVAGKNVFASGIGGVISDPARTRESLLPGPD